MAKLKSTLAITGTLGDISFYDSQDGIIARQKWGPDKKRMRNDPSFEAAKDHGQEFGACSKDSALLRRGLRSFIIGASDNRVTSRVNKLMFGVMKLDEVSRRGERRVCRGVTHKNAAGLLEGFDFNIDAPLKNLLKALPDFKVHDGKLCGVGELRRKPLRAPKGASQAELKAGWLRIDFNERIYELRESTSLLFSLPAKPREFLLQAPPPGLLKGTDIVVLRIAFFKKTGQGLLPMEGVNACAVVRVLR